MTQIILRFFNAKNIDDKVLWEVEVPIGRTIPIPREGEFVFDNNIHRFIVNRVEHGYYENEVAGYDIPVLTDSVDIFVTENYDYEEE